MDSFYDGIVVGLIIGIVVGIPVGWFIAQSLAVKGQAVGQPQSYENKEVWEWTDYKGRERTITVHREVRPVD